MDPNHRGSEEQDSEGITRAIPLIAGDHLLTVNPVDGSEIEPCPPGRHPGTPRRRAPESRAERERAAAAPVPTGVAAPELPLLERTAERERLVKLLRRGRSVRLTGPRGSGRSALLDAVAADCADLAPDGVVRLSGCRRTPLDLMYELFAAVHDAPGHRPGRAGLEEALRDVGAVVLLDDLEFGGQGLDSLLDATPECAFLITVTPDAPAPSADTPLEEVELTGISRAACRQLMEHVVRRPLTEDEARWAADLWFESEGLPLRFVQAGALLRQRDARPDGAEDADAATDEPLDGGADGAAPPVGADAAGAEDGDGDGAGAGDGDAAPRPSPPPTLAEGAAPAALLAAGLSETTREVLRFAVALGGVLPHPAHLPALVDDARADACLGELLACGLVTSAGTYHRLASGVVEQLVDAGYAEGADDRAHSVARHYAWWTGHPSVTPERVAQEAEAVFAAVQGAQRGGHASAAVLLARTAAPILAVSLYWSAWERVLRGGQEAARTAGEVAEEAYFHHDLGVLALCTGNLDRARAELEASIGLRGVLADRRGTVAGRRALALVDDRVAALSEGEPVTAPGADPASGPDTVPGSDPVRPSGASGASGDLPLTLALPPSSPAAPTEPLPSVPAEPRATGDTPAFGELPPALSVPPVTVGSAYEEPGGEAPTRPTPLVRSSGGWDGTGGPSGKDDTGVSARRLAFLGVRRNVLAAGGGALLAALVGTVVALGMTSGGGEPAGSVNPAVTSREDEGITVDQPVPSADEEEKEKPGPSGASTRAPSTPSGEGTRSQAPGTSDAPGKTEDEPDGGTTDEGPGETEDEERSSGPSTPTDTEETPTESPDPDPTESETTEEPPDSGPTEDTETPTSPTPTDSGMEPTGGDDGTVTGSAVPTGSRSLSESGSAPEPRDSGEPTAV
ncbi:ATP-binding protein [Streptomyces sp. TRM43335]|uniref:ATP-binding protein n=1 Tax=Streptomyces taklimakanensis TaxID=2569853 RepID=A0A6G2BFS2_9ACTN|nr:ATP-binding protein [Streptomyces taklimakanensis]MTE21054.1 ATP-binding protein [Streptomyces taklimakanensis]